MRLFYDTNNDTLIEIGEVNTKIFNRDEYGKTKLLETIDDNLVFIGKIYDEPIDLKDKILKLTKVEGKEEILIIKGIASNNKLEGGLRFNMRSTTGLNTYSTNIIVNIEQLNKTIIAFYTLSESLYFLEIL